MEREAWIRWAPQREPYLLVDEVIDLQRDLAIHARVTFPAGWPVFQGHYPTDPIVPEAMLIEAIFQASTILGMGSLGQEATITRATLVSIEQARFKALIGPDTPVDLHARLLQRAGHTWRFEGRADLGDENAAFARFIAIYHDEEEKAR